MEERADIAIHALAAEAERRGKMRGLHNYSYGKLIADTTPEERKQIVEAYRRTKKHPTRATYRRNTSAEEAEQQIAKRLAESREEEL